MATFPVHGNVGAVAVFSDRRRAVVGTQSFEPRYPTQIVDLQTGAALADVEGQEVPEMFCLVTDLMDWEDYPAPELAALYKWRWDGSETALREAKAPLRGAGPGDDRRLGPAGTGGGLDPCPHGRNYHTVAYDSIRRLM